MPELHDLGIITDPHTLADSMQEHAEVCNYTRDGYLTLDPEFHMVEWQLIIQALRQQAGSAPRS